MNEREYKPTGDLAINPKAVGLTWPRAPRESQVCDGVAVISISGPLEHKGGEWGWFESYDSILARFQGALEDDDVHAVILQIDSPGGEVSGLQETVRRMRALKEEHGKPVVAYADDEAYSAAYALACAADEIILPEAGGVGSVGVLATLCDRTRMTQKAGLRVEVIRSGALKADGHPDIPLSDATIARVQRRVDGLAKQFFKLVAEARPVSRKDLEAMRGGLSYGQKAVDAGLADAVMGFDDVLAALAESAPFDNLNKRTVTSTRTDRTEDPEGDTEMAFTTLEKRVANALKAINAATTPAARKKATAAYAAAVTALTEAKVKKSYKKKTVEEEEETDDGEPEDDDDDPDDDDEEEDEKAGEDGKKGKKAEDEEGDEEEEEEEEEEKKMKKGKKAAASSISTFVRGLTGQSSMRSARQVLESMHERASRADEALERVQRLEQAATETARQEIINSMIAAGQLKPSQLDWARTQSIKSLKSFRKATPAMFAPRPPPMPGAEVDASGEAADADGLTPTERKICEMNGVSIESYKKQRALTQGAQLPKVN